MLWMSCKSQEKEKGGAKEKERLVGSKIKNNSKYHGNLEISRLSVNKLRLIHRHTHTHTHTHQNQQVRDNE